MVELVDFGQLRALVHLWQLRPTHSSFPCSGRLDGCELPGVSGSWRCSKSIMKAWDILRQQHAELLSLAREILTLLEGNTLEWNSTRTRLKLATWARKLRVHLTLEERLIYPRLQRDEGSSRGVGAARTGSARRGVVRELPIAGLPRVRQAHVRDGRYAIPTRRGGTL
jgi:hypothetical protein